MPSQPSSRLVRDARGFPFCVIDTVVTAEPSSEFPVVHTRLCSYAELYQLVTALVSALLQHGIQPGDRVASYSSNCIVSLRTFTPGYDSQHHFMIYIFLGKCGSLPCYSGYWWYLGQCRRRLRIRRRFGTVRNGKHDVTVIFTVMCLRSASNRYSPKSFLRLMLWCKWWSCVLFGWYQVFFELACTRWFIHFHSYNQKVHDHLSKLYPLLARLSTTNGGYSPKVIIIHAIPHPEDRSHWLAGWLGWETFLEEGRKCKLGLTSEGEVEWKRLPFDAPLWILFSSGTTGKPKCVILQRNTNLQDINVTLLGLLFIEQEACWFRPRKNSLYVVIYDRKMFSSTILPRSLFLILIPRRVISHFLQGLDDVELSCQRVMYRKHSCPVRWQSLAWSKPAVEPRRWPWHIYFWN